LADLPATLALVDRSPVPDELADLVVTLRSLPSTHVGSGGALAVARFASTLCTEVAGRVSSALTAMAFCEARVTAGCTVLFSASVGHHDISAAAACAREHLRLPLFLVTLRDAASLPASLRGEWIRTIELRGAPPDGFLATNSVLLMAAWLAKAFAETQTQTPDSRPLQDLGTTLQPARLPAGKSLLVLHGYRTEAVALDLETRLQETGLRTVQTVDYRNFAPAGMSD
jgi:fructoselysine-6-P-deglycase FrlB-like protein